MLNPSCSRHTLIISIKIPLAILCLIILSGGLVGCSYYYGAKVYDATASTDEGKRYVDELNIKYICKKVKGFYGTDFSRSKNGVYATGVCKIRTSSGKTNIRYRPINRELADRLGLEPDFSWWERYGRIVLVIITFIVLSIVGFFRYTEIQKEVMEKEPNVEEHLKSIPDDLPNLQELKEAIHNEDLTTTFWAIGELERMGNEHAIEILECAITDKREEIRIAAKEAIARIRASVQH